MSKQLGRIYIIGIFLANIIGYAAYSDETVAIVNGEILTQRDYDDYVKSRTEKMHTTAAPDSKIVMDELINRELVIQDALKKELDKDPVFIEKLEKLRENLLAAMGIHNYMSKHPLNDTILKEEYDKHISTVNPPKEYKTKHILVATKKEAEEVLAELKGGQAFVDIAKKKSIDTGTANQGGELGWTTAKQLTPEFGQAIARLERGKLSEPVKTEFGWHIIQIDDIRIAPLPTFESVKERIKSTLQTQQMQDYVEALKKVAQIEILKQVHKQDSASEKQSNNSSETRSSDREKIEPINSSKIQQSSPEVETKLNEQ